MTKTAAHADAIGTDQILVIVIARIGVESFWVPFLRCRFIEIRVRKQTQADNSRRVTIVRSHRHIFAPRTDFYAGIFLLVLKGIERTILTAHVEPQTETIRARSLGLFKAGFVHQAEVSPPSVAA
jgi:hypothetical protein